MSARQTLPARLRALAALLALAAGPAAARSGETIRLAVYHTNDIHGWIMPRPAPWLRDGSRRRVGGAAALAAVLKREKLPKLVLDAGDWFQGTPEGATSRGEALVEVMNAAGYDAVAVGNHDFDLGQDNLERLARGLEMPVLAANVYRGGRRPPYLRPWVVKEVAGVKVGIVGLLTTNMRNLVLEENRRGLEFRREIDEAREAVKALRKEGATVIIALTHMGLYRKGGRDFDDEADLASEVAGLDLVVGGHSHTLLKEPLRDPGTGALVVQAGSRLTAVGRVELEIDPATKRVVSSSGRLVDLWLDETGEDPGMAALVAPRVAEADRAYGLVVATSSTDLRRDWEGESAIGDWIADCYRSQGRSDAGLQNGGGIQGDIRKGPVTLRDLFIVMPFDDSLVHLELDGGLLREALEHGVGRGKGMIQVSGLSFLYDRDAPPGERLRDIRVGERPLEPGAAYRVTTLDFMAKGGAGTHALGRARRKEFTKTLARDALRACAEAQGLIRAPSGGRMRALEATYGAEKR